MTEDRKERAKLILGKLKDAGITVEDLYDFFDVVSDVIGQGKVTETKTRSSDNKEDLNEEITDFLRGIGMPSHINGFHYVRYAIQLAVQDFSMQDAIVKKLYPAVAEKFNTTGSRVERAIRHAINLTWDRGNVDEYEELFGKSIDPYKGRPTNSEFIATIADHIRLKHGEI